METLLICTFFYRLLGPYRLLLWHSQFLSLTHAKGEQFKVCVGWICDTRIFGLSACIIYCWCMHPGTSPAHIWWHHSSPLLSVIVRFPQWVTDYQRAFKCAKLHFISNLVTKNSQGPQVWNDSRMPLGQFSSQTTEKCFGSYISPWINTPLTCDCVPMVFKPSQHNLDPSVFPNSRPLSKLPFLF